MSTEWKYLWSIVRGAKQGDIYINRAYESQLRDDAVFKVVLLSDGKEISAQATHESIELDYCRVIAEEFVEGV